MAVSEIRLPELGEGVTEGELVKWLVKPGDTVKPDQAVAEVMTDKATVEVPTPKAGVIKELKFKVGDVIKVESVMFTLEGAATGASASASAAAHGTSSKVPAQAATAAETVKNTTSSTAVAAGGGKLIDVKLPELGEGVTEGELVRWVVKPGDVVKPDQSVAEIMTDKATVEVPTPYAGVVKELKFKAGDVLKVEQVLLVLESTAHGAMAAPKAPASHAAISAHSAASPVSSAAMNATSASSSVASGAAAGAGTAFYPPVAESRVLATPATRRLARELGIDINQVVGTGLAQRVTRDDVLKVKGTGSVASSKAVAVPTAVAPAPAFAKPAAPAYTAAAGGPEERVAIRGIRKKIAENMQMAKAIIPHFTLMDEADVTNLVALRESLKTVADKNKTKITYLPFVIKALIATIKEFPMFNSSIDDHAQEIVYKKYFNIGFAADTPNGLVVPVIKNADQKSILQLSQEILDLSVRAREGKLKLEEMKGATITITNIGSVGGTYATPIINHPEVAILGMYKISEKPVIRDGKLEAIKVMNYTITADHRLIDGAVAANFLKAFLNRIQNPNVLMVEMC